MRDTYVIEIVDKHRTLLVKLAEDSTEDQRSAVPEGYNNNIHWHIGHVLTVTELMVLGISGQTLDISDDYLTFFKSGTKPAEWQGEPPAWDVVLAKLKDQPNRIRELLKDKLQMPVRENFAKAEIVEELIVGSLLHEVAHISSISAMLRLLK